MVVVVILGILAAVVVPKIMDKPDEARVTKAKQDIRVLESSLSLYKLDNFNYPSTQQGLEALVAKPSGDPEPKNYKSGGYIQSLPKDPWGSRSEEHTSELQSLMRISYAVFCLKKKKNKYQHKH